MSIIDSTPSFAAGNPSRSKLKAVACVGGLCIERDIPVHELHDYIKVPENLVWLDVQDPGDEELNLLLEEFGFHPLSVEDVAHPDQRPKVDEYRGYLFVVAYAIPPKADIHEIEPLEIDLFVGRNFLVTVHDGPAAALDDAYARWTRGGDMVKEGIGFLVYTVFDAIVDTFFPILETIEEDMDEAELRMFERSHNTHVQQILQVKRTLVTLRRITSPLREVFGVFLRREQTIIQPQTRVYLQDVFDHVLRILDIIDTEREMAAGAIDAYHTVLSNRLNRTIRTLTVITIVVAALSAIFGAWGMNFARIPFADHPGGFWLVTSASLSVVALGVWIAWRRRWL
jgi:magnesium transporter